MLTSSTTLHPSSANDEIDLFEVFQRLWGGRYVVLILTLLGGLAGALYALNAQEKWTSVAYVNQPRVEQVKTYLEQRRLLARVDGNQAVDTAALTSTLFNTFITLSVSARHKMDYVADTDYFQGLLAKTTDPAAQRHLLSLMAQDDLKITRQDKDKIAPYYEFSFSAGTAEGAQQMLAGYLAAINELSFDVVDAEFNDALSAQLLSRQTELGNIEFALQSERDNWITQLLIALETARTAGLTDHLVGRSLDGKTVIELSDSRRLFMLGENYLEAELSTARGAPLVYPTRYYEIKRELELLEPLRSYEVTTLSYDYQLRPTLPVSRDSPKRALIILLGMILGGMLSCMWLLLLASINKRPPVLRPRERLAN